MSDFPLIVFNDHSVTTYSQCDCDCDCACGDSAIQNRIPHENIPATIVSKPNIQSTKVDDGFIAVYGHGCHFALLNQTALDFLNEFKTPCTADHVVNLWGKRWGQEKAWQAYTVLTHLGYLVRDGIPRPEPVPETLTAWLHVTDRCNLDCAYCYVDKQARNLTVATGYRIIDSIVRSVNLHRYRKVKLKYSGGEPLTSFPVVKEIHAYARKVIGAEHELEGVVLSNGTLLTGEIAEQLKALGLRLMISLDELDGESGQTNRGMVRQARKAIALAQSRGIRPVISVTVTRRNLPHLPSLVEWLLRMDLPFSLNFYRQNNRTYLEPTSPEELIAGMQRVYDQIEKDLPPHSLLGNILDRANLRHSHTRTCGVGEHYLVFDTQGQVSKCQMQMERPVTSCDDPDPIGAVKADRGGINNYAFHDKSNCAACMWGPWCTGGCPMLAENRNTPPFCNVYQALFPRVVNLEAKRLLKYRPIGPVPG